MRRNYRQSEQNYGGEYNRRSRGNENQRNWGSARSDYGEYAYGGRLNERGMEGDDWWDRTTNQVSSWLGYENEEGNRRERYGSERNRGYRRGHSQQNWKNTRMSEIMTRDVATVHPRDSVQYAARIMRDEDCGAVPVVDGNGRIIGMITDRDITVRLVADGFNASRAMVSDCMTEEAFTCHVDDTIRDAMSVMSNHQVRRIPIVDDRDRVIGIVSQADLALQADRKGSR
ncbi:MAG TPA: CBS domain-containing protein, partial [Pyrinomonadaceae bacterium]|nr:CBS domain-containing protein [Pyrinomonadaceae bacterium]